MLRVILWRIRMFLFPVRIEIRWISCPVGRFGLLGGIALFIIAFCAMFWRGWGRCGSILVILIIIVIVVASFWAVILRWVVAFWCVLLVVMLNLASISRAVMLKLASILRISALLTLRIVQYWFMQFNVHRHSQTNHPPSLARYSHYHWLTPAHHWPYSLNLQPSVLQNSNSQLLFLVQWPTFYIQRLK